MAQLKVIWYNGLQPERRTELGKRYNNWLNVTDKHDIPQNLAG